MKRPLCMVCLLFAAAVAVCVHLSLPETGMPQGAAGAAETIPANMRIVPAVIRGAAVRGELVRLSGQVYQCRSDEDQTVLWLKKIAVSGMETGAVLPGNSLKDFCICYCEKTTVPQIGSVVCVEGTPDTFSSARNPGEFDAARYYWTQGVTFRLKNARLLSASKSRTPFQAALFGVRQYAGSLITKYVPEREAGVLSAMLLGDKTSLDDGLRSLYGKSGIAHILAISGLHISLLGALLYRALKRMGMSIRFSMALCCAFLISYGMMTGMGTSTLRASVMFMIGLNAERVRRTNDMKTALAVSMAVQLIRNPRLIVTAAFQLSYGAVAGIAWLAPALINLCTYCMSWKGNRLLKPVRAFLSCLAVSLTTLPILLVHQYEYAVYGVFFNLLVLPSVSVLLPAGFLLVFSAMAADGCAMVGQLLSAAGASAGETVGGLLLAAAEGMIRFVGGIANAAAYAAAFCCRMILSLYESGSRLVSAIPGNLLRGRPQNIRIAAYAVMLIGLVGWAKLCRRKTEGRRKAGGRQKAGGGRKENVGGKTEGARNGNGSRARLRGFLGMGWLVLALLLLLVPVKRGLTITMLDVGQGDGICMEQKPGHAVLVDCGSSDQRGLFENRLMPFLKYRGIYELDAVFLSHLDSDHVSAIYDLLEAMGTEHIKVRQIVVGQEIPRDEAYEKLLAAAGEAQVPLYFMRTGEVYAWGDCRLTCLGPSAEIGKTEDRNACSLILRLDYGDFQALFMGDASAQSELAAARTMAACMPQDTIELLKAAHHGSRYSTSEAFLALVSPRIALISAGVDNSYGHPHEEALARLYEWGCDSYQTLVSGAITIYVNRRGMRVKEFLNH
ncbi:MAG: ComEC/Rec2 family competence protein [Lachnospiraceae bacterium]|nr:ComEC/Rec2 family competence protein [Lachnospiraceae bacterium]MDE7238608.1 ComEC/Rec2 family competence protein [Lachnospiraceae bacterium]